MRWIAQDPTTGVSYTFPLNPNKMTTPLPTTASTDAAAPSTWGFGDVKNAGPKSRILNSDPVAWQFMGFAHDNAMLTLLKNIFRIKGRVLLTDHFGRQFIVRFLTVDTDERTPTIKFPYRYAYTVNAISYGQVLTGLD